MHFANPLAWRAVAGPSWMRPMWALELSDNNNVDTRPVESAGIRPSKLSGRAATSLGRWWVFHQSVVRREMCHRAINSVGGRLTEQQTDWRMGKAKAVWCQSSDCTIDSVQIGIGTLCTFLGSELLGLIGSDCSICELDELGALSRGGRYKAAFNACHQQQQHAVASVSG